jgi:hypothetical protein
MSFVASCRRGVSSSKSQAVLGSTSFILREISRVSFSNLPIQSLTPYGVSPHGGRPQTSRMCVRPIFDMLIDSALKIVPAAGRRAHRAEGKTPFVVDIDEFVGCWRFVDKDTEPPEGVDALEGSELVLRDGPTAHAMKTVAAGNVVARDLVRGAVRAKSDLAACWFRHHAG